MRHTFDLVIADINKFKRQVLEWADKNFQTVIYCDNNSYKGYAHQTYEALIACGSQDTLCLNSGDAFSGLKKVFDSKKDWIFGYLGYDLKNEIEDLSSQNHDGLNFPDLFFFQPEWVIEIFESHVTVHGPDQRSEKLIASVIASETRAKQSPYSHLELTSRISKSEYLKTAEKILTHIRRGDIYEMNFCQEFFSENARIEPLQVFSQLNAVAQAPFSTYFKFDGNYVMSSSPERFLKKSGSKLLSMPMKGTAPRGQGADDVLKYHSLINSKKERSENVMIVDLVRNDLSRSCEPGFVQVDELFGIKSFPQVHQMVSTVSGTLCEDIHFVDAIRNAFPMGSMTGAPKVSAMQLIERYESSKRGLYSGAIGYITPNGDFDFNVVIRSLLYNSANRYLSYHVGSAITAESDPEKEYEECLLKAKAFKEILQNKNDQVFA